MTFNSFWNNTRLRNRTLIVISVIIIGIILYYNGSSGFTYAKKYLNLIEKDKVEEVERIKDSIINEKRILELELDSIKQIETLIIKDYWDEFIKERNKNNQLQKIINDISNNIYSKHQLDSIAKYVNYNKS